MTPQTEAKPLPLTSTFAENLAILTALTRACAVLDNPDSDSLTRMQAEVTINMILNSLSLSEQ